METQSKTSSEVQSLFHTDIISRGFFFFIFSSCSESVKALDSEDIMSLCSVSQKEKNCVLDVYIGQDYTSDSKDVRPH